MIKQSVRAEGKKISLQPESHMLMLKDFKIINLRTTCFLELDKIVFTITKKTHCKHVCTSSALKH